MLLTTNEIIFHKDFLHAKEGIAQARAQEQAQARARARAHL